MSKEAGTTLSAATIIKVTEKLFLKEENEI